MEPPGEAVQRLVAAVKDGRADEVQVLVESQPALAGARDPAGVSALVLALYHGHPDIARWLAARRSDLDVFEASSLGDEGRVRALVQADPSLAGAWSPDGFQPLALASFFGHLPVVRLLLAHEADLNAVGRNEGRYTALTGAVTAGHAEVVAELLQRGANARHRYGGGFTPLHVAAAAGRDDLVRLLLAAGASVEARTDDGQTPAQFAAHRGHGHVVALLEERGRLHPGAVD